MLFINLKDQRENFNYFVSHKEQVNINNVKYKELHKSRLRSALHC